MARIIKKYPNRRLYDTETSAYITLAEVKQFVLDQQQFEVHDARTNEDLTRSILLQIILEEEGSGVPMFSADMLANIIRYYGHTMQGLMGNYLERSIGAFHEAQNHFQEQSKSLYSAAPGFTPNFPSDAWSKLMQGTPAVVPTMMNEYLEKSASSVIGIQEELRKQAMQMFSGFPYPGMSANTKTSSADAEGTESAPETTPKQKTAGVKDTGKATAKATAKTTAKAAPKSRAKKASGK